MITINGKKIIRKDDLVFDVGANIGDKADHFIKHGAAVVCFEPQPDCIIALNDRFLNNKSVQVVPKGLADKDGVLTLSVCSSAPTISTFSEKWKIGRFADYTWDKKLEVEITTLDKAILQFGKPRYIKVDVEGYEISVLSGLSQAVDFISFEFTSEFVDDACCCIDILHEIGFDQFNFVLEEGDAFQVEEWTDASIFKKILRKMPDVYFRKFFFKDLFWGDIYASTKSMIHPFYEESHTYQGNNNIDNYNDIIFALKKNAIKRLVSRVWNRLFICNHIDTRNCLCLVDPLVKTIILWV